MSADREQTRPTDQNEQKAAEFFELNTQAVDDLLNANEENSPKVSREKLREYTSRPKRGIHLADWVKVVLIKWWFAAAVCFFFLWGLGVFLPNVLDQLVVTGLALGFVTDLLTNNALRFMAKTKGGNDRWMMVTYKGFWSLPMNLVYAGVIMFLVYTAYNVLNRAIIAIQRLPGDAVPLGVEPILFGALCLGFDLMLIGLKHGFRKIEGDAKRSARTGRG